MNILDRFYLTIYWCGNKGKGGGLIDEFIDKMFMIILFGLLMMIISLILSVFKIDIKIAGILIISGLIAFISSERILKIYYTDERKKLIISSYPKPSGLKYLVMILFAFGSLAFMIFGSIIAVIIYNRLII
jgi:hypothetical protein